YLSALPDRSLGGIVATQVIEHLEPSYLMRVLDAAARTLRAGAPIVLETINPACWLAFFSSYIRDFTHVRPVHPETLQYLLRASGFERVTIRYSAPVPEHMKMKTIDLPADVLTAADAGSKALAQFAPLRRRPPAAVRLLRDARRAERPLGEARRRARRERNSSARDAEAARHRKRRQRSGDRRSHVHRDARARGECHGRALVAGKRHRQRRGACESPASRGRGRGRHLSAGHEASRRRPERRRHGADDR